MSNVRDIVFLYNCPGAMHSAWHGYILKAGQTSSDDEDHMKSNHFSEVKTQIAKRVTSQNFSIDKIYVNNGPVTNDDHPGWRAIPRVVNDKVVVIDSLDDDASFAIMLLSLE